MPRTTFCATGDGDTETFRAAALTVMVLAVTVDGVGVMVLPETVPLAVIPPGSMRRASVSLVTNEVSSLALTL